MWGVSGDRWCISEMGLPSPCGPQYGPPRATLSNLNKKCVPRVGFKPTRANAHWILSPTLNHSAIQAFTHLIKVIEVK